MRLFTDLLFLHGHITDPRLAASLARTRPAVASPAQDGPGLLQRLRYLGGRPMHPGHNYDLDEPFEPAATGRVAAAPARACSVPQGCG